MNKWLRILILLLALWLASTAIASLMKKGDFSGDKIAVIPIKGEILLGESDGFLAEGFNPDNVLDKLKEAEKDKSVKGVILEINTGGGSVVGSKEIVDAVKKLKQTKPVVALIRDIGASGGYWIASAADKIVADELSLTGSIGVLGSYIQFAGIMEKYGVEYERLVAGNYKDMGVPFRKLTEDERSVLQKKINEIHNFFIKDVAANRKLDENEVRKLSTGEPFLGIEAKNLGLIDELGNIDKAFNITKGLAGIEEAELVKKEEKPTLFSLFSKFSSKSAYYMGRGIGAELKAADASALMRV